ncbi:MAG: hypothetical protein AB9919_01560 [Geobacteraceae bacterium]
MSDIKQEAVIIGGDFQGLGIARNLSGLGLKTLVVDPIFCISKFSRHVDRVCKSPAYRDPEKFTDFLIDLAATENLQKPVLFPTSDIVVRILSTYRDKLSPYFLVPTPPWEVIKYAYDKKNTHILGIDAGVPVPETLYPEDEEDLSRLTFDFPVILKPAIIANFFSVIKVKALRANNLAELVRHYRFMASIIDKSEIMVQELIQGGTKNLYSFCSFFRNGEVRGKIMARRLRQHPMDFGTATTYAITCNIPELEELATRVLRRMNYYGLSEVEFMFDEKVKEYKLIDINTRTWAWHTLGAKAGVNFPLLLFKDMHNEGYAIDSFETGIKWFREVTDLSIVLTELLKGSMTIREYLQSLKGKKELAVFSFTDPLPFFADLFLAPYRLYERGFRV